MASFAAAFNGLRTLLDRGSILDGVARGSGATWATAFVATRQIAPQGLGPLRRPIDEGVDRLAADGPQPAVRSRISTNRRSARGVHPSASRSFCRPRGGRWQPLPGRSVGRKPPSPGSCSGTRSPRGSQEGARNGFFLHTSQMARDQLLQRSPRSSVDYAARCVALNPVRAPLVKRAERWWSAVAHLPGRDDDLVSVGSAPRSLRRPLLRSQSGRNLRLRRCRRLTGRRHDRAPLGSAAFLDRPPPSRGRDPRP